MLDVGLALLLLLFGLFGTHPASENQVKWSHEPDTLAYLLVTLAALPFVLRRRYPGLVLAASAAAVLTYMARHYAYGPIMFTIPAATYMVGAFLPLRRAIQWAGGYYVLIVMMSTIRVVDESSILWWQSLAWEIATFAAFAAPLVMGAALRIRRQSQADVRTAQARRAVSEERLRMAQELHDSIGHGLAVIAMQAGVALHVLDRNPAKVREALEAIRETSKESLDGLRAELQALQAPSSTAAPRRPAPGLSEIDVLLNRIRAGGVTVHTQIDDVAELPAEVDVAAYRIVQESLTNVLRHAGATHATVRIARTGAGVTLDIGDNGRGGSAALTNNSGMGIAGMRARAEALDGVLEAGPRAEGGFGVHARLPIPELTMPGSAP
jgi:signal transduction histidine kinase